MRDFHSIDREKNDEEKEEEENQILNRLKFFSLLFPSLLSYLRHSAIDGISPSSSSSSSFALDSYFFLILNELILLIGTQ